MQYEVMKIVNESLYLLYLRFYVLIWNAKEQRRVRKLFYCQSRFASVDQALRRQYRFRSPFRISKKFLQNLNQKQVHCYGETPITGYDMIAKQINLSAKDRFIELGSGRGRGVFFLSSVFECFCQGVEIIPEFILKSLDLTKKFQELPASFILADMSNVSLKDATVIYFFGLCFEDEVIEKLCDRMKFLSHQVKIITVSFPLTDYRPLSFRIVKTFEISFNWGVADVFVQTPTGNT